MITEDRLIGWLCIARHQWSNGAECILPAGVLHTLVERGWLRHCDGSDGCTNWNAHMTDQGYAITDLDAADWGINSLPEEIDA